MVQGAIEVQTRIDNSEVPKDAAELDKMLDDAKSHIMELAKALNLKVNPITIVDNDVLKSAEKEIDRIRKQIQEIKAETNLKLDSIQDDKSLKYSEKDEKVYELLSEERTITAELYEKQKQLTDAVEEYKVKQAEITAEKQRQKELADAEKQRQKDEAAAEKQYNSDVRDVNSEVGANLAAEDYVNQIQSLQEYERELENVQMRMQAIEEETERLAAEKGVNPDDALAANSEYQKLNKKLEALNSTTRKFKSTSADAFGTAKKNAASVGESVKGLIKQMSKYALAVFGARSAFFAIKNAIRQVLADNQQLTNTVNGIKGVFANALAPYVEKFVYYLQYALAYVNLFIKTLTGVDMVANYNAKALKKQAEATKATAKATKEANNQLASFDEKNVLSSDKSNANSGGTAVENAAATLDLPDVSGGKFEEICETIKAHLAEVEAAAGIAMLAVGFILLACGQIPMGIAAIIAGIALEAKALGSWNELSDEAQNLITAILAIAGGAFLAIGIILCATSVNLPLGITMIAVGAAALVTAAALNWGAISSFIEENLTELLLILGGALLVIGAILTFSQVNLPLGIALMAAGAISLIAAAALNWDAIKNKVKIIVEAILVVLSAAALVVGAVLTFSGVNIPLGLALLVAGAAALVGSLSEMWNALPDKIKDTIAIIVTAVSAALLALGAILAFTAANIPLGIGLMAAGAAMLITTIALNWNKLSDDTKNVISIITAIVSAALLVLGIILCVTGANLPLGIALIAAGAAGLVTVAVLNKDVIKNWVSSAWSSVTSFWNNKIKPIFTKEWWTNKLRTIADGAKNAINTAISFVEKGINWMVGKINGIGFNVPSWVPGIGGSRVGFNLPYVNIPRLAKGGIVNNPGKGVTANIGEAGKEAVLPLDNNTEWMETLAEKIADKLPLNTIVKVYVDGKELYGTRTKTEQRYTFATNGGVL